MVADAWEDTGGADQFGYQLGSTPPRTWCYHTGVSAFISASFRQSFKAWAEATNDFHVGLRDGKVTESLSIFCCRVSSIHVLCGGHMSIDAHVWHRRLRLGVMLGLPCVMTSNPDLPMQSNTVPHLAAIIETQM